MNMYQPIRGLDYFCSPYPHPEWKLLLLAEKLPVKSLWFKQTAHCNGSHLWKNRQAVSILFTFFYFIYRERLCCEGLKEGWKGRCWGVRGSEKVEQGSEIKGFTLSSYDSKEEKNKNCTGVNRKLSHLCRSGTAILWRSPPSSPDVLWSNFNGASLACIKRIWSAEELWPHMCTHTTPSADKLETLRVPLKGQLQICQEGHPTKWNPPKKLSHVQHKHVSLGCRQSFIFLK